MKITKTQLAEIIKEELSTLREDRRGITVGQLEEIMQDAFADGKVVINNGALEIYEWYEADGNVYLSVEPRR